MVEQRVIEVRTARRGTFEITGDIRRCVADARVRQGLCHVFIQHTSASLLLSENADPAVRHDLETFLGDLVPDGDPRFRHDAEGPDDMPAHIRSVLTASALSLPVSEGRLALGTWQGIFVWEHRTSPHRRRLVVTLYGEA